MDYPNKRKWTSSGYRRTTGSKRFYSDNVTQPRRSYKANYANIGKYRKFSRGGYYWKGGLYGRFSGLGNLAPESKYYDSNFQGYSVLAAGGNFLNTICNMQRGTSPVERVGERVSVKSIQGRFQFTADAQAATNYNALKPYGVIKIQLVQDTQCNGTPAVPTEVMRTNIDNGSGVSIWPDKMRDITYSARYKVLWEEVCVVKGQITTAVNEFTPSTGVTITYGHFVTFDLYHKEFFKKVNIPIRYDGQSGPITVANIRTNNLFVLVGCNTEFDGLCKLQGTVRIRFTDV